MMMTFCFLSLVSGSACSKRYTLRFDEHLKMSNPVQVQTSSFTTFFKGNYMLVGLYTNYNKNIVQEREDERNLKLLTIVKKENIHT